MTNHPITPPPELVQQWVSATESNDCIGAFPTDFEQRICTAAAQWGAAQELEACCEWLDRNNLWARCDIDELRDGRRPKPPSLKQQILALIDIIQGNQTPWNILDLDVVRKILEALPDD